MRDGLPEFDSYLAALRLVTDLETLAALVEQIGEDRRLTPNERAALFAFADARHMAIRPDSLDMRSILT